MKAALFVAILLFCGKVTCAEHYRYTTTNQLSESTIPHSSKTVMVFNDPHYGKILTDNNGRTLYVFTSDRNNVSTCDGECSEIWPPFTISAGPPTSSSDINGSLSTMNRQDNTLQVTYNGMPLYYYVGDFISGDTNGQQIDNRWFVINPNSGVNKIPRKND